MWQYFSRLLYTSVLITSISTHASSAFCQSNYDWIYVSGDTTTGLIPTYPSAFGEEGSPGGRWLAATWVDESGNLWLFGGRGHSTTGIASYGDMWKFNVTTNRWYWMGGSTTPNSSTYYPATVGYIGQPGSRQSAATWIDDNGDFWLFGGVGKAVSDWYVGDLNDLWKYEPDTSIWIWQGGTKEILDPGTYPVSYGLTGTPAARSDAATGITPSGDLLLFGGTVRSARINDLWRYSIASQTWTWLNGSSTTETLGQYPSQAGVSGYPGARRSLAYWTDSDRNLWIFGGWGVYPGFTSARLNDLWRYEPGSNQFYYMGGTIQSTSYPANLGEIGTLGGRNSPNFWTADNRFWLSGGFGRGPEIEGRFNDLWAYDPLEGKWRFMDGPKEETSGIYPATAGQKGLPQGRVGGQTWTSGDRMYLYGGSSDGAQSLADMWYHPTSSSSNVDDWQLWE